MDGNVRHPRSVVVAIEIPSLSPRLWLRGTTTATTGKVHPAGRRARHCATPPPLTAVIGSPLPRGKTTGRSASPATVQRLDSSSPPSPPSSSFGNANGDEISASPTISLRNLSSRSRRSARSPSASADVRPPPPPPPPPPPSSRAASSSSRSGRTFLDRFLLLRGVMSL